MPRAIMSVDIHIRPAIQEELAALTSLINASVRQLQSHDYTIEQIEGALQTVFGVDTQLITDGTYLVAEARSPQTPPIIVACGGWSKR
jgi:hypothetical protein